MQSFSSEIFKVREISAEDTYTVRLLELRKGMTVHDCQFEDDTKSSSFHIGGFYDKTLVGVATFIKNNNELHALAPAYQLRGMAVLEAYWKKGYGEKIILFGEELLRETTADYLWMNARKNAFGFYEKLGHTKIGPIFEVPGIGTHQVLFKKINHNR